MAILCVLLTATSGIIPIAPIQPGPPKELVPVAPEGRVVGRIGVHPGHEDEGGTLKCRLCVEGSRPRSVHLGVLWRGFACSTQLESGVSRML